MKRLQFFVVFAVFVIFAMLPGGGYLIWKQHKLAAQQAAERQKQAEERQRQAEKEAKTLKMLKEAVVRTEKNQLGRGREETIIELREKNAKQFLNDVNLVLQSGGFAPLDKDFQHDFVGLTVLTECDAYDTLRLLKLKDKLLQAKTVEDFRSAAAGADLSLEEKEKLFAECFGGGVRGWRVNYIKVMRKRHQEQLKALRAGLAYLEAQKAKIEQQAFEKVRGQLESGSDYKSKFKFGDEKDRAVLRNARDTETVYCSQFGLNKSCGWKELSRLEAETRQVIDEGNLFIPTNKKILRGLRLFPGRDDNPYFATENGCLIERATKTVVYVIPNREGKYEIPSGIVSIGGNAFQDCNNLQRIELPESLQTIGRHAFNNCDNLTAIKIPEGVTEIGDDVFDDCWALQSVELPESLKTIGRHAFGNCWALQSVELPESLKTIGARAFALCKTLTAIKIPEGVTAIEENTFWYCENLRSIELPESLKTIGKGAFVGCHKLTAIKIPEGVTEIGDDAFHDCWALQSVELPESLRSIGMKAFRDCRNLTAIKIPEGVTTIGEEAFQYCNNLRSIELPESLKTIGKGAFRGCHKLTAIKIPEGVTAIEENTFWYCENLRSIELPESLKTIGRSAFGKCEDLTAIKIPEGVTTIGEEAFRGCKSLTYIEIPEDVKIGRWAFAVYTNVMKTPSTKSLQKK